MTFACFLMNSATCISTSSLVPFAAQSAELKEAIEKANKSLEDAAVGNRALLSFGAFWLGVGVLLGSFEHEIVMFLGS